MLLPMRAYLFARLLVVVALFFVLPLSLIAQINTDIVEQYRMDLQKQAQTMKRDDGTHPDDWAYALPEGVTTRQVTFYVDGGTPLYGKIFFPRGFSARGKWPAVVVGHGNNALAIGIEKYGARFADYGLVAMAIDYRTYGFSGSAVSLLEPDTTSDERMVWEKIARVQLKRTDYNLIREVVDFRAAISFLQGEPGIDPDRIGIWGSSAGGAVVASVAALDARVKVVVTQVSSQAVLASLFPSPGVHPAALASIPPDMQDDMIKRARTGQGAEVDGGFYRDGTAVFGGSFRSKMDMYSNQVNREMRMGTRRLLERIPETTKILSVLAEHDELTPEKSLQAVFVFKGTWQEVTLPYVGHFQMYSGAAFEVGSTLAADWFLKCLGTGALGEKRN